MINLIEKSYYVSEILWLLSLFVDGDIYSNFLLKITRRKTEPRISDFILGRSDLCLLLSDHTKSLIKIMNSNLECLRFSQGKYTDFVT